MNADAWVAQGRLTSTRKGEPLWGALMLILLVSYPVALLAGYKIFYIVGLWAFAMMCLMALMRKRFFVSEVRDARYVYLFFGVIAASYLWAFDPPQTLYKAAIYLIFPWIFAVSSNEVRNGNRRWLNRAAVLIPFTVLALALGVIWHYGVLRAETRSMYEDVGSFANSIGALVTICLPYLVQTVKRRGMTERGPGERLAAFCAIGAVAVVVVLSESRGAILNLLVSLVLLGAVFSRSSGLRIMDALILLLCLLVPLLIILSSFTFDPDSLVGKVVSRFKDSQIYEIANPNFMPSRTESDYARALMYYDGVQLIRENPVRGIGYGGFRSYFESRHGFPLESHNIVITLWGELGLAGLLVFGLLLLEALRRLWRARSAALLSGNLPDFYFHSATLSALLLVLLQSLFRPQLENPLLYAVLGAAFAIPRMAKAKARRTGRRP